MMKPSSTLLLACALVFPAAAWAQPAIPELPGEEVEMDEEEAGGEEAAGEGEAGDSQTLLDEDPSGAPGGAEENPDDPTAIEDRNQPRSHKPPPPPAYPLERTRRPLTLFAGMSEVVLDASVNFDPFFAAGLLQARYGITSRVEAGLRYGAGALDEEGFTTGKTLAADATYRVTDFLAVQLSVPVLLDPFALGVTLGAPMKFRFGKLRFDLGHDLLGVALHKFVPDVGDPLATAGLVADEATNTTLPAGDIRVLARVTYQHSPKLTLGGESGVIATDFSSTDAGVPLRFLVYYSPSNRIDLGARFGFGRLDDASKTVGVAVVAGVRI